MSDTVDNEVEFDPDVFDQMVYGNFEPEDEEVEDEGVEDDEADTAEELDTDNDEDQEDTDQEEESEDEEELDEADDGEPDEDLEDEEEDEEEDALVEDDDSDDEDDVAEEEEDAEDEAAESEEEDSDEESEDDTDTEDDSDGDDSETTDEVDYKAFYDAVVNTEFVVNGKKTKGFSDPQKIIQSQQMAGGFSEKMAGFKQYRPFMSPLKERGMLEDQAKFDLAMNLIDGDKEAIKAHLQTLNIDPLELDMEKIDYSGKTNVASQESLIIEDVMDRAKGAGIDERLRQVIGKEWDASSFQEFVGNEAVRNDLLNHMETGVYDIVQDKMAEMSRLDYNGAFGSMNTVGKYRAAVSELQKEYNAKAKETPVTEAPAKKTAPAAKKASVKSEKAKIEEIRKQEEYKEKAAEREAKVAQQRKRAASMSKKKPKAKPKAKFDPLKVEGEELDELMNFLASGGRG